MTAAQAHVGVLLVGRGGVNPVELVRGGDELELLEGQPELPSVRNKVQ